MPNHLLFIFNIAAIKVIIKERRTFERLFFVLFSEAQPLDHLINGVHLNSTLELVIVVGISNVNEKLNQNQIGIVVIHNNEMHNFSGEQRER
jgi:hypothetical protein